MDFPRILSLQVMAGVHFQCLLFFFHKSTYYLLGIRWFHLWSFNFICFRNIFFRNLSNSISCKQMGSRCDMTKFEFFLFLFFLFFSKGQKTPIDEKRNFSYLLFSLINAMTIKFLIGACYHSLFGSDYCTMPSLAHFGVVLWLWVVAWSNNKFIFGPLKTNFLSVKALKRVQTFLFSGNWSHSCLGSISRSLGLK